MSIFYLFSVFFIIVSLQPILRQKMLEAARQKTHDYPLSVKEAQDIGLTVSTDMPTEMYQLMNLFPQTAQRRPSVEYIPLPYAPRDERHRQPKAD